MVRRGVRYGGRYGCGPDAARMRVALLLWVRHLPRATRAGIVPAVNQEFGKNRPYDRG